MIKLPILKYQKWIITFIVIISFGASLSNGYSFDDELVTTEMNVKISKGFSGIYEILTSPYSSAFADRDQFEYRPITQISFAIEKEVFGFKPAISHLINLILYIYLCLLVFKILRKLLQEHDAWIPFFVVLIFSIHPLHSEVVVSLKNREELLVALFGFGCLNVALSFFESQKNKWLYLMLFVLFLALGLNTKSSFIPFIYVIPFVLVFFKKTTFFKGLMVLFFTAAISSIAIFLPRSFIEFDLSREILFLENPLYSLSYLDRIPMAFYSFFTYLKLHLLPYPLVSYYGYSYIELKSWSSFEPYLGLILLVVMVTSFFYVFKNYRILALGIALFLLFIAPYQNFPFPVAGIIAERFTFNSVLAFAIILVAILDYFFKKYPLHSKKVWYFSFLLVFIFSIQNISRTKNWNSLISLLEVDTKNAEKSAKLQMMYGDALLVEFNKTADANVRKVQLDNAILAYKKAVKILPNYFGTHSNLGVAYSMKGDYLKAIQSLKIGLKLGDNNPQNIFNLGACYELNSDTTNALKYYSIASSEFNFELAKARISLLKNN